MYFQLIKSQNDKTELGKLQKLNDSDSIRKILYRWGVTQCESCEYTDTEILQWIKWAIKNKDKANAAAKSDYVGEIGVRFGSKNSPLPPIEMQLLKVKWIDGFYGSTGIHNFVDKKGNFFVWFASSQPDLEVGEWYNIAGTPKRHQEDKYNSNAKTTTISRASLIV